MRQARSRNLIFNPSQYIVLFLPFLLLFCLVYHSPFSIRSEEKLFTILVSVIT